METSATERLTDVLSCSIVVFHPNPATVLLARQKKGFNKDRYNGYGGKIEAGELPIENAIRETEEEAGVGLDPSDLIYSGSVTFIRPKSPEGIGRPNSRVIVCHLYRASKWQGSFQETDSCFPAEEFSVNSLPLTEMPTGTELWLPLVLEGKVVHGSVVYGDDGTVTGHRIEVVS